MRISSTISFDLSSKTFYGEAQIRHINPILLLPHTHQKVLELDILINNTLEMHIF